MRTAFTISDQAKREIMALRCTIFEHTKTRYGRFDTPRWRRWTARRTSGGAQEHGYQNLLSPGADLVFRISHPTPYFLTPKKPSPQGNQTSGSIQRRTILVKLGDSKAEARHAGGARRSSARTRFSRCPWPSRGRALLPSSRCFQPRWLSTQPPTANEFGRCLIKIC